MQTTTPWADTSYTTIHPDVNWIGNGTLNSYSGWIIFPSDFYLPQNLKFIVRAGITTNNNSTSPVTVTLTTSTTFCGTLSGNIIVRSLPGIAISGCGTITNNATFVVAANVTYTLSSVNSLSVSKGGRVVIEEDGLFYVATQNYNPVNIYTSYSNDYDRAVIENHGTVLFNATSYYLCALLWEPYIVNHKNGTIHVSGFAMVQFNGGGRNDGKMVLDKGCQVRLGSLSRNTNYGPVPSDLSFYFSQSTVIQGEVIPQSTFSGFPRLVNWYHVGIVPFSLPVVFSGNFSFDNITLSVNGTLSLPRDTSARFRVVCFQSGNLTSVNASAAGAQGNGTAGELVAVSFGYIMAGPRAKVKQADVPVIKNGAVLRNLGNMSVTDSVLLVTQGSILNEGRLNLARDGDWPQTVGQSSTGILLNSETGHVGYKSTYTANFPYPIDNFGKFESDNQWSINLPFTTESGGVLVGKSSFDCINNPPVMFKSGGTFLPWNRYFQITNCSLVFDYGGVFRVPYGVQLKNSSLFFRSGSVLFEESRIATISGDAFSALYVEPKSSLQVNNTALPIIPSSYALISGMQLSAESSLWPSAQLVGNYPGLETTTSFNSTTGTLLLNYVSIGHVPTLNLEIWNFTRTSNTTYDATITWKYPNCPPNATVSYFVIVEKSNTTSYTTKVTQNKYLSHRQQFGYSIDFSGLVSCVLSGPNGYPSYFGNSTLSPVLSVKYPTTQENRGSWSKKPQRNHLRRMRERL